MLKTIRKKGNIKAVMWILAIIIIPAFVLWGGGSMLRDRRRGYAGKIFRKKVSLEEYLKSWEASRDQALMIYGRLFNQVAQYLDFDSQAWDRLILLAQTKKEKIKVSDQELIERIRNFPLFQKNGKFNPQTYDWVLKYHLRTTPVRFEEQMRQSLKISKLVEKIYAQVSLTEAELKEEFVKANEKAKFSYLMIEARDFLSATNVQGEKELLNYYAENKERLRKPDSVKVEYILINPSHIKASIDISGQEIKEYFQGHPKDFISTSPKTTKEKQTEEDKKAGGDKKTTETAQTTPRLTGEIEEKIKNILAEQKAEEKVEEIKNKLVSEINPGVNFEELAKKHGISFKETDYFSLNSPIPEIGFNLGFYNSAFNLNKGEVSGAIEAGRGYIFLKVKDKKSSYIPEFSEVKKRVEELLKKEKAARMAKEKAQELIKRVQETSFEQAAKEFNLTPVATELINRRGYIEGIGKSDEFTRIGFSLTPGQTAKELIQTNRGYVLLRMDEKVPINDEDFQKGKETFKQKILAKKQTEHFEGWFKNLKMQANLQSNVDKLKQNLGLKPRVSP